MKWFFIIVILCTALLCPGFALPVEGATPTTGEQAQADAQDIKEIDSLQSFASDREEFIWKGWAFNLGKDVTEIIANLGKPGRITTKRIRNRHDPKQTDIISNLFYDGLEVATYQAGYDKKEFIILVAIKNSRYKAKFDIVIGSKKDNIISILGKPSKQKKNILTYEDKSGYADVNFYFRNNMVYKIEWLVFPD